ncbi:hypothetical protein C8Q77DRAFT_1135613, partial [Trametes polyzona]
MTLAPPLLLPPRPPSGIHSHSRFSALFLSLRLFGTLALRLLSAVCHGHGSTSPESPVTNKLLGYSREPRVSAAVHV